MRVESSVLTVDCGGSGIKFAVLDAQGTMKTPPQRVPTPYPLPPQRLIDVIAEQAAELPEFGPLWLGCPACSAPRCGCDRTPHYICERGPRTQRSRRWS